MKLLLKFCILITDNKLKGGDRMQIEKERVLHKFIEFVEFLEIVPIREDNKKEIYKQIEDAVDRLTDTKVKILSLYRLN